MRDRKTSARIRIFLGTILVVFSGLLSGCGDRTQMEDRDFIMSLWVGYEGNQYKVIYERPDLTSLTGQGVPKKSELLVSYTGKNMTEIEEKYGKSSQKQLDYNHLKAIVLHDSIASNSRKVEEFLSYVGGNYQISRNTLVFYSADKGENVASGFGEKLENLYENNPSNRDVTKVTIGDLINCRYQSDKVLILPQVKVTEQTLSLDGGAIVQAEKWVSAVTEAEFTSWNLLLGKATGRYVELEENTSLEIKKNSVKYQYTMSDGIPNVLIYLTGEGEIIQESAATDILSQTQIEKEADHLLEQKLLQLIASRQVDILNLYRRMSYSNPIMWKAYKGKQDQFLQEVNIQVQVDMKAAMHE